MPAHVGDRRQVHRGVLADCGVRAPSGLDSEDTLRGQRAGHREQAGVLLGVDVVGDRAEVVAVAEPLAEPLHEGGLAGPDRAPDADAERAVIGGAHDLNNLVYWVSWWKEPRSALKVELAMSSSPRSGTSAA